MAALEQPSRFRTRLHRKLHDGPQVRKDPEDDLRSKWVQELSHILQGTPTKMLAESPSSLRLSGAERRESTIWAKVGNVRKVSQGLAALPGVAFLSLFAHLVEYLQMRSSEPCNRGSLKNAHQALHFLEDVAGVEETDRLRSSSPRSTACKELISTALLGKVSRQAPEVPHDSGDSARGNDHQRNTSHTRRDLLMLDMPPMLRHDEVLRSQHYSC